MPRLAKKPCRHFGCKQLVDGGYCDLHKKPDAGSFADDRRGSSASRGYGGSWQKKREYVLKRDKGLCQECLRKGILTKVGHKPFSYYCDHIIPKFEGGSDDDSNLQALCKTCHVIKTDQEKTRAKASGRG